MGLFSKKDKGDTIYITQFFTIDELNSIENVLRHNMYSRKYRAVYYQTAAKEVIGFAKKTNKKLNSSSLPHIQQTLETIQSIEPDLNDVLQKGINKIQAYESGVSLESIEAAASDQTAGQKDEPAQRDELLKAIGESGKSYDEIMEFLNKQEKQE